MRTGIALARDYWESIVRPILDEQLPDMPRAAARVGPGSDVLALDDEMSRDHDWGLRLQLFVPEDVIPSVVAMLDAHVPEEFAGLPTRFGLTHRAGPDLAVDVLSVHGFAEEHLGFDPRRATTSDDWLSLTGQAALEVTAGQVFDDTAGELSALREALSWYPDPVWRHVVACDWYRIDQELPLMARCGHRGDELGSGVIAARLLDIAMHLGFLLCRQWAPYPKWRGTGFSRLPLPNGVGRHLVGALTAKSWVSRNQHFSLALEELAVIQAASGLPTAEPACVPFWDRPFLHINPSLVQRLRESISDPAVRALPAGLGSIEQRSDNVDLLVDARLRRDACRRGWP